MENSVPAILPAAPATTVPAGAVALRPKQEGFAVAYVAHGNASKAYRENFECAGTMKPANIRTAAYDLLHSPQVAARVRELFAAAAADTIVDARSRMVRLQQICEADPGEVARVVTEPCHECRWDDDLVLAAAMDRGLIVDTHVPRDDCPGCHGNGRQRVIVTPTDQLSPAARRLVKSVRMKGDGSIEVQTHCQLAATDMLNRMQSVYVEKSLSISATVSMPALKDMTPEAALDFLESIRPTSPPPNTTPTTVIDHEPQS